MGDMIKRVEDRPQPSATSLQSPHQEIVRAVAEIDLDSVRAFAATISAAAARGRWIYTFGNGGSAGAACHFATELAHIAQASSDSPLVRALSLSSNVLLLTAMANDYGFESIFEAQLRSSLVKGDVVLGISSSGVSKNVLRGLRFARTRGATVLGLTGSGKTPLASLCDQSVAMHSRKVYAVESAHLCFIHLLTICVRQMLTTKKR